MAFRWSCGPEDFVGMGETARPLIGLSMTHPATGERFANYADALVYHLSEEARGPVIARWLYFYGDEWKNNSVLDFGCGHFAVQVEALRLLGWPGLVGYEWPPSKDFSGLKGRRLALAKERAGAYKKSVQEGMIDPAALQRKYDLVLASNVVNVQPTWGCFSLLMRQIKDVMARGGAFVCNLASEPRRVWRSGRAGDGELDELLKFHFGTVDEPYLVPKKWDEKKDKWIYSSDYVWECHEPRQTTPDEERDFILELLGRGALASDGGLERNPGRGGLRFYLPAMELGAGER